MKEYQEITMRHVFQPPKGMLWASADFQSQEARIAGALSNDPNIIKIYKLAKKYELEIIPKPVDPNGNEYEDPNADIHIIAASNLNAEVKRLMVDEPWFCHHKKNKIVKEYRQSGKILNYCLPLDTEVLTKEGWKTREHLKIGDLVVGINQESGYQEWTPIIDIYDFDISPLVNIYSEEDGFNFTCTPNHRWLARRGFTALPLETKDISKGDGIITATSFREEGLEPYWREARRLTVKEVSPGKVFCIRTANEGFTIKQGDSISHTLNSLIYLASAESLAEDLKTDVRGAQKAIDDYFSYPDGFYKLGKWLKVNSIAGAERRWIRTFFDSMCFTNDSNAKGLDNKSTVGRKSVNSIIQGAGAVQIKLAFLDIEAGLQKLNDKYRNVVRGREACVLNVVHKDHCAL